MTAFSLLDGTQSTIGTTTTVSGIGFTWNVLLGVLRGFTPIVNIRTSITYDNLTSFSEPVFGTTNAVLVLPVTVNWRPFVSATIALGSLTILVAIIYGIQIVMDTLAGVPTEKNVEKTALFKWLIVLAIAMFFFSFMNRIWG